MNARPSIVPALFNGSAHPLIYEGIAVYQCGAYWRISYTGTILYVEADRLSALERARLYAKHFGVTMRVFE